MATSPSPLRSPIAWLAVLVLALAIGAWQISTRALAGTPEATPPAAAQPYSLALLPEYQAGVPLPPATDIVDRSLFNPTRRPAPPAVAAAETAKPRMQKGQFALAGTMMIDNIVMAFLRETPGGKSRKVRQGENLNGMMVADIKPDRVRLTLGDESEDLVLKVVAGPKTTIQPVMPGANRGPVTATAAANAPAGGAAAPRDVAEVLAERRRQARAAELAAQGQAPGTPAPQPGPSAPIQAPTMPPVPQGDMGANDPRWQQLYQRYQQPRR